jgi:glycosyltransferase 2 family protein
MRSHARTAVVIALAGGLFALFLRDVDLSRVGADIVRARPGWLAFGLFASSMNLVIRAYRWQYLLEPLGRPDFGAALRATAVGFAANAVLPARAGEVIRPYFLARSQRRLSRTTGAAMNTTGAFATIIVERLLDVLTVIILLAVYVFVFGRSVALTHPAAFIGLEWAAATAAVVSLTGLIVLFVMAGNPERLRRLVEGLTRVLPSTIGHTVAHIVEKFAQGLGVVRQPLRLAISVALSIPLWLTIAAGTWAVAVAFDIAVPFTGTFLIVAFLSLGVAVPTPGAVGGFHAAFRYGATTFFDARDEAAVGAAIIAHLFSIVPSLFLGLLFAAQEGLSVSGMRQLADEVKQEGAA